MHKRTEITVETERFLIISQRRDRTMLWCNSCAGTVPMLTVDEAARTRCVTPLVIFRLLEAGTLHFALTAESRILICRYSLVTERADDTLDSADF